jgi:hypothetical protein
MEGSPVTVASELSDVSLVVWILAGSVTFLTGVVIFVKWVKRQFDHGAIEAARPVIREEILAALRPITAELRTNGGTSLRDAVNRTEASLEAHRADFAEHVERDDEVAQRVMLLGLEVRNIQQAAVHPDYPPDRPA